jgi:hypothetical protein
LVNTDPKATRETLRNAGKKLRADSTLVPDIVGNIKLRPDLVDKLPDLKTMRAKVETAYPTIDVRVSAIKIDPPTDKELARLAGRVIDPKDPSTAFTRATRQVLEARTERTAVAVEGSAEEIKQANIKLRRALRNLRRVQNFNYVPKTDVSPSQVVGEIEFGVVEKSPGQSLTPEEAATVLNNANTQGLFGSGNENWLVYAAKESLRKLRKLGNIFDQGSLATVGSEIPIIARLSHLISSHNLYTDSFGFSKLVGPGLEQRKRRVISKVSKVVVDLFDDTKNLDDTTQQLLMQHAMAKVNNIAMTPLTPDLDKIADSMANRLRFLFQEFERRGLSSGYFRGTLDSYSGTFMIRPDKRDLSGLTEAFYKYFERKFTDPNATLHRKTMHDVPGWYKYDTATNKWIPDEIAKRYTKIPENLSDLTAADQATYLGILRNTATDPSGNYIQGLRLEAQKAAKNKLGMVEYKDSADIALVRPDATMERSLEVDIWFDPDVAQFVDWRIGEGLMSYANTTAYRISEKEGINLFVQSLLGVNRLDFTSSSLVDGIESVVLNNPALDDVARNKIKQSFQFLRNQVNALRESSVSDITRKQGITDDLVTIMGSIARVPVSARSALAGTVTELPMLLMSVLAKDGAAGVGRIVKDILNGATQDQLKGIIAGYQWMRNHIPFTLQYVAESTTINRNWLDKVWVNPVKSIVGAETAMDKTKAVAAWLHHASSGLAGEDLFQGWVSGIAVHSASVRMIRFLDKMVDLSNRMQSYNWAIEKDPERVFRRLAREAGFGEDAAYAARLNQAGLLDPNTLKELFEIDKLSGGRLLDKDNGSLNHGILEDILINNPKYRDTIERIIGFKETELTRHVTVPGVQDVNIPMGGLDPASKLKNMFTGFARSWFNNIMLNHIGNEKLAYSLFIISVGLVGEALYNTALRTLYHDESLESVLEEWEKEPVSSTALVFGRSNMLGTANIIPMLVVDMFAKSNGASTQASSLYPVTQTMKLMRSSANIIKASLDSDKEVSEQDANVTESFILGFNAWWMKSIYDATGWNGPAHWLLGIDPKKQPAT